MITKKIARTNLLSRSFAGTLRALTLAAFLCVSSAQAQQPTLKWHTNYGSNSLDGTQNVLPTSDGGYLVVGVVGANTGDVVGSGYLGGSDGWVIKRNASGAIDWKKAYGTTSFDNGIKQAIEVSDGYVLAGSQVVGSLNKLWYAKVSKTTGAITWSKQYNSTGQSGGKAIVSTPEGYLIGGVTGNNGLKAVLLRTNTAGVITATYTSNPATTLRRPLP